MAKLYPPSIEGTIPAFSGTQLTVPFIMNKTVSWNQIDGFYIRIKSITNNSLIYSGRTSSYNTDKLEAYFNLSPQSEEGRFPLKVGVSYKIQIAYIDKLNNNEVGYYSTVGIVKYTETPEVTIEGLSKGQLHANTSSYIGKYSQFGKDVSEKVYSYCFTVYDQDGAIFETTGNKIHNHEHDSEIYESIDKFDLNRTLEENKIYTIEYSCITTNGMYVPSPRYRIIQQTTVEAEINANVVATMNEENGYVNISLLGNNDDTGSEVSAAGVFLLARSSSKDNYREWVDVERFALFGEKPSTFKFKDFTVEHGYDYQYSLQQYNKEYQVYSNRMLSNIITAKFEHSFLFDGQKQLKIKFNPKVSSFKETLLESKTNTLGAKYPFFYRNGNVGYKEFPISGLISYQMDEEELFLTNEEMLLDDNPWTRKNTLNPGIKSTDWEYFENVREFYGGNEALALEEAYREREKPGAQERLIADGRFRTTNLTDYNIVAERTFKMKVLDWLNNGQPKLFRSPGEGNFLVRLMNTSLSPDDKLSRMLHTFSTTATEIDEFTYLKLGEYGLTKIVEPDTNQLRWKTYNFRELINYYKEKGVSSTSGFYSIGNVNNIYSIQVIDMIPGDRIKLIFKDSSTQDTIQIGTTGAYSATFDTPIVGVEFSDLCQQGQITISYSGEQMLQFDTYRAINISDIPIRQFIGPQNEDIKLQMEDIKNRIEKYYFINFTKRPIMTLEDESQKLNPLFIYQNSNGELKDGQTGAEISDYNCKIMIDNKEIDITETIDFQLIKPENLPVITFGNGVVMDISVQRREIEYDVETERNPITNLYIPIESKRNYATAWNKLQDLIRIEIDDEYYWNKDQNINIINNNYQAQYNKLKLEVDKLYKIYLEDIEKRLIEKGVKVE